MLQSIDIKGRGLDGPRPKAARRARAAPTVLLADNLARPRGTSAITEAELPALLHRLDSLTGEALPQEWANRLAAPLPAIRSRDVLRRIVAWRIQAQVYGGFDGETFRRLRQLIADYAEERPLVATSSWRLAPGTVFSREWKGCVHRVTVEAKGFAYKGKTYASLSEIARLITGTRWSGPRLFGLETTRKAAVDRRTRAAP